MDGVLMRDYYSITELTREFDISTRTLRFYEDEGLIQPIRRGRTRLFRPSDRHLVKQIMRGKRLGFSIAEIREIIQIYKEPPGEVGQLKLMIRRIEEKREDLRQKRRDLEETLAELDHAEEIMRRAAGRAGREYVSKRIANRNRQSDRLLTIRYSLFTSYLTPTAAPASCSRNISCRSAPPGAFPRPRSPASA